MKVFTLRLNGQAVPLIENDEGLYNLNELHKLSGANRNKAPSEWIRLKNLNTEKSRIKTLRGRSGGTWAPRRMALKYAGYLDDDFEDAVYEAFENLMDGKIAEAVLAVERKYAKGARDETTGKAGRASNRVDSDPDWFYQGQLQNQ